MCNATPDQMQMLERTVRQFLDQGRMFSAYDVTLETREREHVQMRHKDVRGACHEIQCLQDAVDFGWDDPSGGQPVEWGKTQVSVGQGQWAFIYHPRSVDPNTYQPRPTFSKPSAPSPVTAAAPATPSISAAAISDSGGQNADGTFGTDYRNRLFIPTKFLRGAGLNANDECFVVADKANKLILLAGDDSNLDGVVRITTQRVERNGDLRLSSTTLTKGELDTDKFVIENTDRDGTACILVKAD